MSVVASVIADGSNVVGHNPVPDALQIAVAWATVFGSAGVLAAIATFWFQWCKTRQERAERANQATLDRQRHDAQIKALKQAEDDRLSAQARRVIPAIFPGDAFSRTLWNVRVDNWGSDSISAVQIDIFIVDQNGNIVSHGYRLANRASLGEAMLKVFLPEFSRAVDGINVKYQELVEKIRSGTLSLTENPEEIAAIQAGFDDIKLELNQQTAGMLQAQVNHAIQTQLTDEWPTVLAPGCFTAMAIETTRPDYIPHLKMRFEDSSGYVWERTDTEGPRRIHEPVPQH
jgi:hypothetical protein